MRDLIASNAPLREGSHKARQNPPKHYPRGFKGPQPLGTPFSPIFRRATKDGAPGGRWFSREVGKKRAKKDMVPRSKCPWGAPGGPTEKRMPVKRKTQDYAPGGRCFSREVGKNEKQKITLRHFILPAAHHEKSASLNSRHQVLHFHPLQSQHLPTPPGRQSPNSSGNTA